MASNLSAETSSQIGHAGQESSRPLAGAVAGSRDAAQATSAAVAESASTGLDTALAGFQAIRSKLEDAAQALPSAPWSSRMAWRAGRWLGRAEGVIWLASKGIGVWWSGTKKRLSKQQPNQWARLALQWGPCAVAIAWMTAQLVTRARRSATAS